MPQARHISSIKYLSPAASRQSPIPSADEVLPGCRAPQSGRPGPISSQRIRRAARDTGDIRGNPSDHVKRPFRPWRCDTMAGMVWAGPVNQSCGHRDEREHGDQPVNPGRTRAIHGAPYIDAAQARCEPFPRRNKIRSTAGAMPERVRFIATSAGIGVRRDCTKKCRPQSSVCPPAVRCHPLRCGMSEQRGGQEPCKLWRPASCEPGPLTGI
jgi:hypothetical protein